MSIEPPFYVVNFKPMVCVSSFCYFVSWICVLVDFDSHLDPLVGIAVNNLSFT